MRFIAQGQPNLEHGWSLVETYVVNGYGITDQINKMREWLDDDAKLPIGILVVGPSTK